MEEQEQAQVVEVDGRAKVFQCMPTHSGQVEVQATGPFYGSATADKAQVHQSAVQCSLLPHGFNMMFSHALVSAWNGEVTHFAMQHADIIPEGGWLNKMLDIMDRVGADVLSAVVMIKGEDGTTSTAIDNPRDEWDVPRMHKDYVLSECIPSTFCAADIPNCTKLLVNTGLMLVDLRKEYWKETFTDEQGYTWLKAHFRFQSGIRVLKPGTEDQSLQPCVKPEDWEFSRIVADMGGKVYATREIDLGHMGHAVWRLQPNAQKPGKKPKQPAYAG